MEYLIVYLVTVGIIFVIATAAKFNELEERIKKLENK